MVAFYHSKAQKCKGFGPSCAICQKIAFPRHSKSHKTTTNRPERYVPGGLSLVMKVWMMKKMKMKEMVLLRGTQAFLASPSGKMILLTKKKITMEMPPLRRVVPML